MQQSLTMKPCNKYKRNLPEDVALAAKYTFSISNLRKVIFYKFPMPQLAPPAIKKAFREILYHSRKKHSSLLTRMPEYVLK